VLAQLDLHHVGERGRLTRQRQKVTSRC
jgi:hypothetical protein